MASASGGNISKQFWEPKGSSLTLEGPERWWTIKGIWYSWLCFCSHEWIYWWKPNVWWGLGDGKGCSQILTLLNKASAWRVWATLLDYFFLWWRNLLTSKFLEFCFPYEHHIQLIMLEAISTKINCFYLLDQIVLFLV